MEMEAASPRDEEAPPSNTGTGEDNLSQAVRFASASMNQEIEPSHTLQSASQSSEHTQQGNQEGYQGDDGIQKLASSLHNAHIQQRRMSNFTFEPCSLPVSRAPSNESTPYHSSREQNTSNGPSPQSSPPASAATTPPLTPHGTQSPDSRKDAPAALAKVHPDPAVAAPQIPPPKISQAVHTEASSISITASQPSTGEQASTRPTSISQDSSEDIGSKRVDGFTVGPSGSSSSQSQSREPSPDPKVHPRGQSSATAPVGSKPHTPIGEKDDPYARSRRPAQPRDLGSIDARFIFGSTDVRRRSGINNGSTENSSSSLRQSSSGKDLRSEHRKSTFSLLGGKEHHGREEKHAKHEKHHGSMSNLTRFFGLGGHHKARRGGSPAPSARGSADKMDKSGSSTPPRGGTSISVPFAEDHGLEKKYGKFSKLLGSGAGGSVRLMNRASDGRTFAVKQFRDRHNYETVREYNKKVTAEFCIGSTLHHGNIIETLDIIQEQGHWFEVMEYAPFDLFAIVMTGKMAREEITCCFLQIVNGVSFLHASGLAHRDLKLDNVVVNGHGIMKIIDFGSASVFKYPFENDIVLASGVVGSDPYLAPEVYDERKYDPQPADVWSLAIIFACMSLRRFPWKAPRLTDNSFKLFIAQPATIPEPIEQQERPKSTGEHSVAASEDSTPARSHHHHHYRREGENRVDQPSGTTDQTTVRNEWQPAARVEAPKAEAIKGPWRLLRLLPRETRAIIGNMLKVDPRQRATLKMIEADPWVRNAPVCQQLEQGKIVRAGTHNHILEPGSAAPASSAKH